MGIFDNWKEKLSRVPEYEEMPVKTAVRKKQKKKVRTSEMLEKAYEYVKERQGKPITSRVISKDLGYGDTNANSGGMLLLTLMKLGKIERVSGDARYGYAYKLTGQLNKAPVVKTNVRRPVKPPVEAVNKLLRYISNHQGEFMTFEDMEQSTGISRSTIGRSVLQLVKDGKLERSDKTLQGTRYRIPGNTNVPNSQEVQNTPAPVVKTEPSVKPNNDAKLLVVLEPLMWQFLKETRSTDILLFLTWLEERKG